VSDKTSGSDDYKPQKATPTPIEQKVGWTPEPVWKVQEKRKISCPCCELNPRTSSLSKSIY
jgi:hypothetical protein